MRTSICWFRRDLRIHDHPALAAAVADGDAVVPVFVLDERLLRGRWPGANRMGFMLESLVALRESLRAAGGYLVVRVGRPEEVIPRLAGEVGASTVHVSRDYGVFGRARDRRVAEAVGRGGARFVEHPGVLVHEPEEVVKDDGTPFAVFTPFRRRWDGVPVRAALPAPAKVRIPSELAVGEMPDPGARAPGIEAGEGKARQRLAEWVESDGVRGYRERRDFVGEEGTSRLSAALRWGLVSPVEVLELAAGDGEGAATFRSEVCWRDFYAHTLWWHPRVLQEPYQRQHAGIAWRQDVEGLAAWKAGRTGYPIVDAGMRELVATGWMHNRARMIVASFLSKDLLVDWREGEAFFMEHLVDGDPASNGGGWQWAASVGTDAQPYFRVFNPVLQGKKFDPDGTYVRRWIPELRGVPERYLHEPWAMPSMLQREVGCVIGADYPAPVVDHQAARTRAISAFRA